MTSDIIFPFDTFTNINRVIFIICKIWLCKNKLVSGGICFYTTKLLIIERILPFFSSNSYNVIYFS